MTKLMLVYRDITHGGSLDPEAILCLGCVLFCAGAIAILAINIWRDSKKQQRVDKEVGR